MLDLLLLPQRALIWTIKLYQKTISFDHGVMRLFAPYGYCKFYPSCSEYAVQALRKKGLFVGSMLATKRLIRCHPWSEGGVDQL